MRKMRWSLVVALVVIGAWLFTSSAWVHDGAALPDSVRVDRIVVIKHKHSMELWSHGQLLKTYQVALGRGGAGPKAKAGDDKVPEGTYLISGRNSHSAFYRALRIGYPTTPQVQQDRALGIDPGGDIMIHGIRNGMGWIGKLQRRIDWTKGCIAVTNVEMDEIWRTVPDGIPINIQP